MPSKTTNNPKGKAKALEKKSKQLKELRKKTGLTRETFAKRYNIPLITVANWECGYRECPDYVIELLEFKVNVELENGSLTI